METRSGKTFSAREESDSETISARDEGEECHDSVFLVVEGEGNIAINVNEVAIGQPTAAEATADTVGRPEPSLSMILQFMEESKRNLQSRM